MKTEHPLQNELWNLLYSKVIAGSVNTFIPVGDEMINFSLVERHSCRCRSVKDPQTHPPFHFLVRLKPTSTNVIFQVTKNVVFTSGKIWDVRRMLKSFPVKTLKLIPHQISRMGTGVIMQTFHYAHLHSNNETIVWTCAFSLCISPTLQMTISIRNNNVANLCEECVLWQVFGFHLTDPYTLK